MAEAATSMTWTGLLRAVGRWLRENLPMAIVMSAISFGLAWLVNFFYMAFRWDGFRAPTGSSDYIAAENSLFAGSLFWAGFMSLVLAVGAYGYRVGPQQLLEEILSLPTKLTQMFRGEERNRSLTTLAWAAMLSLLLGLVISPAVAAVAAGFFIVFAATPLGDLLSGVIRRLWMQVIVQFAPHKGEPTSGVGAAAVTAAGMVAGFAIAAVLDSLLLGIVALIVTGLAAYYFANQEELGPGAGTAVFLLVAAAIGLYELFEAGMGIALADDGGWSECGNCNIIDYITSTGATEVVSRSTVAGGGAAVGAPIGAAVGDILGNIGGGGGAGPSGGGGGGTGPSGGGGATDSGDVLGSIGGGGGGGATTDGGGGDAAPAGDGADGAGPADGDTTAVARTGDTPTEDPAQPTTPTTPTTAATAGTATVDAEQPTAGGDDANEILGAIGGGEGGAGGTADAADADPSPAGDDTVPGDAEEGTAVGVAGTTTTRRGDGQPADAPDDMPPPDVPTEDAPDDMPPPDVPTEDAPDDMPPPDVPTEDAPDDMPPPDVPTQDASTTTDSAPADMPPPQDMPPPVAPPPSAPPGPADLPPAADGALPPGAGSADEPPPQTPQQPADADEQPSTGVWGRDTSGWLNDAATRLGEAKDTLEGWIDDLWGEEDAAGIKETLQTERIGENLEAVSEATDTYNHFHDMAGETIDDLNRLGVDENGQNAVTWLRVVAEGAGRATQTFVDGIVTPVVETVVAPFGGDAEQITHTLLPVQETAEEFSQAIHNGARNIRGGDNYAGQMAENRDLDLESLWRFP